jgi:serine/threonine protein kinase
MQPLKCFSTGSRALSSPFLWTRIRSHAVQQYQMAAYSQLPSTRDGSASSPYTPGTTITINGHVPPPPTNPTSFLYRHMNRLEKAEVLKDRKSLSLADRCRKYPPIQTQPPDSKGLQLKIVKPLRVGVSNPSQVVVAMVESIAGGAPLIAKIFDSFYWDHEQYNIDPFRIVDYHYSHEAAAYVKLRDLQGSYVPKYYGSYTCELPLDSGTRSVRLVLLEYIQGTSLEALGPDVKAWLPQAARQNIMEKLIRAESYVYAREVDHGDLYPRNVIIQSKDVQSFHKADLRLVLFDFASASVGWDSELWIRPSRTF